MSGGECIRAKRVEMGTGGLFIDTNTSPLAVYALSPGMILRYQLFVYDTSAPSTAYTTSGPEYTLTAPASHASATGVTLPAGKIVRVWWGGGSVQFDPSPSSWPAAGPLG